MRKNAQPTISMVTPRLNKAVWAADLAAALMAALISVISLVTFLAISLAAGVVANVRRVGLICVITWISPEEAVRGVTKEIRIPTLEECDVCHGSGAKAGTQPQTCPTCHGSGQVQMRRGFFAVQQTCPHCQGRGTLIKDPCHKCHGHGRVEKSKTLSVKIPAGVDTGDRIRLAGEGEAGEHGAPAGDLYVQVRVKQHPIFEREGNNLYCEVPINFAMAALGGEIEVPTLDGRVMLKVPSETQTGKLFRMRGKGVKSVRGGAQGDLLCRVVVETPVGLSEKQKQLLKDLQESFGGPTGRKTARVQKASLTA